MNAMPGGEINKGEEKIMTPAKIRGHYHSTNLPIYERGKGNMKEEKEITESEINEMLSNLKTTEENERGKGNMNAMPGGDINKGEEKIMTPAEVRWICNNMKTMEEIRKFYRSPFYAEWDKKRAMQRAEAYAKIALEHYNGQNGTNFELHEVAKSCSYGIGAPVLYFHMNFVAKSSDSETYVMFFAELARERSKVRVRVCCLLDPVFGMKTGCKFCGRDMHHPTNVVLFAP